MKKIIFLAALAVLVIGGVFAATRVVRGPQTERVWREVLEEVRHGQLPSAENITRTLQEPSCQADFAVIGDFGQAGPDETAVAALVESWQPDFIATVGDNNYPDGEEKTIDVNIGQYFHQYIFPYHGTYGEGAKTNRFFPALGNHDWHTAGAAPYLEYFELPGNERYYDQRWGPVHLFIIDSSSTEPDGIAATSKQARWLQDTLATSTAPWKIVLLHHPPYSSGATHGSSIELRWPYREWGADIVLAGHDHLYERLEVDGFPYIVNGLGGNKKYGFAEWLPGSLVRYNEKYGAVRIVADDATMTLTFMTVDGEGMDTLTLTNTDTNEVCGPIPL